MHREFAAKTTNLDGADARHKLGWSKAQAMGAIARVVKPNTRDVEVQTVEKKGRNRLQPREEAKGITQCIKASAFREINKICDEKFRPKCFESTLECIKQVRGFLIAHFGPVDDKNYLVNKVERLSTMNDQLRLDLEICLHLVKTVMESEDVASRACLLRAGPKVTEQLSAGLARHGIVYQKFGKPVVDFSELLKFVPTDEKVKKYDM